MLDVEFRAGALPYDDNRKLKYPVQVLDLLVGDPDVVKITDETGKVLLDR